MIQSKQNTYLVQDVDENRWMQAVFFSREEAREYKREFEYLYGGKYKIVRVKPEKVVR